MFNNLYICPFVIFNRFASKPGSCLLTSNFQFFTFGSCPVTSSSLFLIFGSHFLTLSCLFLLSASPSSHVCYLFLRQPPSLSLCLYVCTANMSSYWAIPQLIRYKGNLVQLAILPCVGPAASLHNRPSTRGGRLTCLLPPLPIRRLIAKA